MKVIVFGSRGWDEPTTVKHRLAQLPEGSTVVHGNSAGGGADYFADVYARALGFTVLPMPVNTSDHEVAIRMKRPKFAPLARNMRMARTHSDADLAIGFWDGKSPGSKHMKKECELRGIPVEIIAPTHAGVTA